MTTIRRSPAPPGPVTELFERLDQLHLEAGRPSMREIATRVGRGRISSSTVHNVFRNSRVPRWSFLEDIVKALRGDTAVFLVLWQAAAQAESKGEAPEVPAAGPLAASERGPSRPPSAVPASYQRIWSAEIPAPNPLFTGRERSLRRCAPTSSAATGRTPRRRSSPALARWARRRSPPGTCTGTGTTTRSSGGSGPSTTIASGMPSSGWASGWSCGPRPRQAAVAGAIAAVLEALGIRRLAELAAGLRQCDPAARAAQVPARDARRAAASSSPRECSTGPATWERTASRSRPSASRKRSTSSAAGCPALNLVRSTGARTMSGASREPGGWPSRSTCCRSRSSTPRLTWRRRARASMTTSPCSASTRTGSASNCRTFPSLSPALGPCPTALLTADAEHLANLCAFFSPEPIAAELFTAACRRRR